jgi:hypothetical protein
MRNDDGAPGRGLRSIQLWRRLAAARRALEQPQAVDGPPVLEDVLRELGIDESLFDVVRAQPAPLESAPATGPPAALDEPAEPEPAEPEPAAAGSCVVRSTSGRVSLRIVEK